MSFIESNKLGKEAEKAFVHYLIDNNDIVSLEISQGKFKDYDIKMTTKDSIITYEVKSDRRSEDTWNLCIEYMYNWHSSWIYSSKADYIVYYCDMQWWIQDRWLLLWKINDIEKEQKKWGDGNLSRLFLIKVDKLPELFERLDWLPKLTTYAEITQKTEGK